MAPGPLETIIKNQDTFLKAKQNKKQDYPDLKSLCI